MPLAQRVAAALKGRGWVVPGISTASSDSPYWDNELIYYHQSEPNAPPLEDILKLLDETSVEVAKT